MISACRLCILLNSYFCQKERRERNGQKREGARRRGGAEGPVSGCALLAGFREPLSALGGHAPVRPMHGRPRESGHARAVRQISRRRRHGAGGRGGRGEHHPRLRLLPAEGEGYRGHGRYSGFGIRRRGARYHRGSHHSARRGAQNRQPDRGRRLRQARRGGGYAPDPHLEPAGAGGNQRPLQGGAAAQGAAAARREQQLLPQKRAARPRRMRRAQAPVRNMRPQRFLQILRTYERMKHTCHC